MPTLVDLMPVLISAMQERLTDYDFEELAPQFNWFPLGSWTYEPHGLHVNMHLTGHPIDSKSDYGLDTMKLGGWTILRVNKCGLITDLETLYREDVPAILLRDVPHLRQYWPGQLSDRIYVDSSNKWSGGLSTPPTRLSDLL